MLEKDRYADAGGAIGAALAMDPTRNVYSNDPAYRFFDGYYQTINTASFTDPTWTYTSNSNAPQNPVALLNLKQTSPMPTTSRVISRPTIRFMVSRTCTSMQVSVRSIPTLTRAMTSARILSLTTTTAIMASHAIISTIS